MRTYFLALLVGLHMYNFQKQQQQQTSAENTSSTAADTQAANPTGDPNQARAAPAGAAPEASTSHQLRSSDVQPMAVDSQEGGQAKPTEDENVSESMDRLKIQKDSRVALNGAAKKRFKYYKRQGMTSAEALEKAKQPVFQKGTRSWQVEKLSPDQEVTHPITGVQTSTPVNVKGNKRNRSDHTTTPKDTKRAKTAKGPGPASSRSSRPPAQPRTYAKVAGAVKIGVACSTYPEMKLSKEDCDMITRDVLKLIAGQRTFAPKFCQLPTRHSGWMVFHCSNKETADWLRGHNYWTEHRLSSFEEKDFPRNVTMIGYFKMCVGVETATILGCLEAQNTGLPATSWVVKARKDEGTLSILTVEVDHNSNEWLTKNKFLVEFGMGQSVRLRPTKGERPRPTGQAGPCNDGKGAEDERKSGTKIDESQPSTSTVNTTVLEKKTTDADNGTPSKVLATTTDLEKAPEVPTKPIVSGPTLKLRPPLSTAPPVKAEEKKWKKDPKGSSRSRKKP